MPCSRMPKCSVRPYGLPGHRRVWCSVGMNEGSPSIVVRLLSARSAEPPHSSGSTGASAVRTSPDALRVAMPLASGGNGRERRGPPVRQPAGGQPVEQRLALRVGGGPLRRSCLPLRVQAACRARRPGARGPAPRPRPGSRPSGSKSQDLLGRPHLVDAERGAVRRAGVLLVRGRPADDRAQRDERRRLGVLPGGQEGLVQRLRRPRGSRLGRAPAQPLHVPAIGLVAGADVLGLGDVGVVLDGDLVVVVEHDEVAELLVAGQRGRLVADALLDIAVGDEAVDVVVERAGPGSASGSNRPRSRRAAIAMPTALPRPWPSGPVVVSTPGVSRCSGCPGVMLPQVR